MAAAGDGSHNQGWKENDKFEDGDATSRIELRYGWWDIFVNVDWLEIESR
jgi:hypothetical protein